MISGMTVDVNGKRTYRVKRGDGPAQNVEMVSVAGMDFKAHGDGTKFTFFPRPGEEVNFMKEVKQFAEDLGSSPDLSRLEVTVEVIA